MAAERAGYTVTLFLVDVSRSMGNTRTVDPPDRPNGEECTKGMTNLQWSLQFAKLKIQEMIYHGRKTDQCGVILFGSDKTDNTTSKYPGVVEYIPIRAPNANTIAQLDAIEASKNEGDAMNGISVAYAIQERYLERKKTWTRKIVLITDGQSPLRRHDWQMTTMNLNQKNVQFTVIGVDFDSDDEDYIFKENGKSDTKRTNEGLYKKFVSALKNGVIGSCAYAIREISMPGIEMKKSVMTKGTLSLGDPKTHAEEAFSIFIRTSKCTAVSRPLPWGKYAMKLKKEGDEDVAVYAPLKMTSEYYLKDTGKNLDGRASTKQGENATTSDALKGLMPVNKDTLVRGYKYGTGFVPCPNGEFTKLPTKSGLEICDFFLQKDFRRELPMGEIQYIWGDPDDSDSPRALSSIVHALHQKNAYALARWVTKDNRAPKMGVLAPCSFEEVDCLLWAPMPFGDDVREYLFPSLDHLVNEEGEELRTHPYLPTKEQCQAMDNFVDAMDLMEAGDEDENGVRGPWFDTRLSYNPALHRTKQAMVHSAVVNDLETNPLPPPHPEVIKYLDPPENVLKRARGAIEECKDAFRVREGPNKVLKIEKDEHLHAQGGSLEDRYPAEAQTQSRINVMQASSSRSRKRIENRGTAKRTTNEDGGVDDDDHARLDEDGPAKTHSASRTDMLPAIKSMSPYKAKDGQATTSGADSYEEIRRVWGDLSLGDPDDRSAMLHLMTQVTSQLALESPAVWRTIDSVPSEIAQRVMNILQTEVDASSTIDAYGFRCFKCLRALGKKYNILPDSFSCRDVVLDGSEIINSGGFGDIYKGTIIGTQAPVCLKVLKVYLISKDRNKEKVHQEFCREALIWRQLRHPRLLSFLGVIVDGLFPQRFCLVSPWMKNGTITDFLQRHESHDRFQSTLEIAEAIRFLHIHEPPIIHADIRGSNILVSDDGHCLLGDFGISLMLETIAPGTKTRGSGAHRWMAPEAMAADEVAPPLLAARDIYSFGCTLIEIYSGKVPFHYIPKDTAVMIAVLQKNMPDRPSDEEMSSADLRELVVKCLSPEPEDRPTAPALYQFLLALIPSRGGH